METARGRSQQMHRETLRSQVRDEVALGIGPPGCVQRESRRVGSARTTDEAERFKRIQRAANRRHSQTYCSNTNCKPRQTLSLRPIVSCN
jgi:hypothetical protein